MSGRIAFIVKLGNGVAIFHSKFLANEMGLIRIMVGGLFTLCGWRWKNIARTVGSKLYV